MMTGRRALAGALLMTLPLLSCFSDRTGITPPTGADCRVPADAIGGGRAVVLIRDFAFFPDTLRVRPGTTVTWVNCEAPAVDAHTATADAGNWDSGSLPAGATYSRTFEAAGAHPYFCRPHPAMRGTVVVR